VSSRDRDRLAFCATVAVNLAVLLAPSTPGPSLLPGLAGLAGLAGMEGMDKAVHALVFAAVAGTGVRVHLPWRALLATLLAWAVVSELIQGAVLPSRAADGWDVLADVAGTLFGLLAASGLFAVRSH
jgi:hypothetical protein